MAQAYWAEQRFRESEAEARRAIAIEPDSAAAYGIIGSMAMRENRLQEAIESFKKAISIDSNKSWYHVNLGVAYQMDRQHVAVIEEYKCAFEIEPSFEAAWRVLIGYITKYRWLVGPVQVISLLLLLVVRSSCTVPIFLLWVAFTIGNVLFNYRTGQRVKGTVLLLFLLLLIVLYVYNLLYGL